MRETIINIIETEALKFGYTTYSAPKFRQSSEIKKLPAVWICPIAMVSVTGREEGVKSYKVEMELMKSVKNKNGKNMDQQWEELENNAAEIYKKCSMADGVVRTKNLVITPIEHSQTNYREIAVKATFETEMYYCSNQ